MEIQVARLREVLGILKPAVPRRPTLTILSNVMVKEGQAIATDLDSMVILSLPEANEPFLFPYTDVLKMLQYVPGHEYLTMLAKRGKLTLSWSEGSATFPTSNIDEFPSIPDFEIKTEAAIDGDTFMPALQSVLPYTATGTERPVLNGVTVIFGGPIEVAAGDGFRMAHVVLPLQFPGNHITIIPSDAVSTLMHVWEKTPRTPPRADALMPIIMAKRQIQVALDGERGLRMVFGPTATVIVKLVEGNPPTWLKLIPKEEPILQVKLFAREFETAVRRVSNVANQGIGIVRLQFTDGAATVSAKHDGHSVSANIAVLDAEGTPNRVALNVGYLIDYLKNKDGIVSMAWTGGTAPVAFQHSKSPKVLIMPMEAVWDDKQPGVQTEPEAALKGPEEPSDATPTEVAPVAEPTKPRKRRGNKEKK